MATVVQESWPLRDARESALRLPSPGRAYRGPPKASPRPIAAHAAGAEPIRGAVSRTLTRREIRLDAAIHGAGIIAGLAGALVLLQLASAHGERADVVAVAIYSAGLLVMLGCSCAYNLARPTRHRDWLRCLDNSAIFLMIASTYTPFTVLHMQGVWSVALTCTVWLVAAAGIAVRVLHEQLFDRVYLGLYMALGWIGLIAFAPLVQALDANTLALLMAGGLLYTIGVAFHLWERLPFNTAIWHGFVVCAAATHYAAVLGRWAW